MYEDELIQEFVSQKLSGWTTRREWLLMDLVAVKVNPPREYRGITFDVEVYEFKSNHDNPMRVFEQLPYYVWVADRIWLVLGEKHKPPKGLPCWLGVQKYDGEHFQTLYEAKDEQPVTEHVAFAAIKGIYLPQYALPSSFKRGNRYESFWVTLKEFVRKWFANSVLAFNKKPLIPYSNMERALLYFAYHVDDVVRHTVVQDELSRFETKHFPVNHEDIAKLHTQLGLQKYFKES